MEVFIGTIMPWPFDFEPKGWLFCKGQQLEISKYPALAGLIKNTYGGDMHSFFCLPDLRGRVPVGVGLGGYGNIYQLGNQGGSESVGLNAAQMPSHSHDFSGIPASTKTATGGHPGPNMVPGSYATSKTDFASIYSPVNSADTTLGPASSTGTAGGGQTHNNMQPYLVLNFIIAYIGEYPTPE